MSGRAEVLGLWSGVGLVVANMIGSGVFLSAGFMAQQMGPGPILLAWVVGAVLALAGARAYAEMARLIPRSGGEYRYLSDVLHPLLGCLAGWTSLLVGFSAPVAAAALGAGYFTATLVAGAPPLAVGAVLIVWLTAAHAAGLALSRRTQNTLALVKGALLLGFTAVGLSHVPWGWPAWQPPAPAASALGAFMTSLFFVAFAFSGWNAAVYAASEFRAPERDVPRALLVGCALVAVLYLAVNWVFVSSLTPERAAVVLAFESKRVTLGHLVMRDILGEAGGRLMSVLTIVAFVSSMSAMTFVGPRVYAAMARDGYLPRALAGREGSPPAASVALQGALSLVLLFTHTLQQVLINVGAILTLFAALVALSLFGLRFSPRPGTPRPGGESLTAAGLYAAVASWMLWSGFRSNQQLLVWVATILAAATGFYLLSRFRRRA